MALSPTKEFSSTHSTFPTGSFRPEKQTGLPSTVNTWNYNSNLTSTCGRGGEQKMLLFIESSAFPVSLRELLSAMVLLFISYTMIWIALCLYSRSQSFYAGVALLPRESLHWFQNGGRGCKQTMKC